MTEPNPAGPGSAVNPAPAREERRVASLITRTIESLKLDLGGFTVLTEAATGPYSVTPVIAAMAGSERVIAMTRDSRYGSADEATEETMSLARSCGVSDRIEIRRERRAEWFEAAHIVTNLGFVRPIDAATCQWIRPGRVVPLMCEAWEWRAADVDLVACHERGIRVFGTNEDHESVQVFAYCGWLALKLVLDAGFEGHKTRVLTVGPDNFARVITARLKAAGVSVHHALTLTDATPEGFDVVIVADYGANGFVIGPGGHLDTAAFVKRFGPVTVIPFVGQVDVCGLESNGARVFPPENVGSQRMVRTLAALGPRPVIDLHAAGLKVASMSLRGELPASGEFEGLAQPLPDPRTQGRAS